MNMLQRSSASSLRGCVLLVQVTDIHVLLYNTMMSCGITPHEMFLTPMEERPSPAREKIAPPKQLAPTISKATSGPKKAPAADRRPPNVKLPPSDRSPSPEESDSNKTPKKLTQKHMQQWIADRNGVCDPPSPSMD